VSKPTLQVIIGSTRPGRVGPAVAQWVADQARQQGEFEVEIIDLKEVNLPLFDEPNHPMTGIYTFEHSKAWSATVSRADAFLFVIPEYNHSFNAAVKNAIDYLNAEWRYKPAGIVSYGGASSGIRAAQALKPVFAQIKLSHAGDLPISLITTPVVDGVFQATDAQVLGMMALMAEIQAMHNVLQARRA